jgi:hypothetical protein
LRPQTPCVRGSESQEVDDLFSRIVDAGVIGYEAAQGRQEDKEGEEGQKETEGQLCRKAEHVILLDLEVEQLDLPECAPVEGACQELATAR